MSTTRSNASRLKEIDQRLNAEKNFLTAVATKRTIGEVMPYEGALTGLRKRYELVSKANENMDQESARLLEDVVKQINEMKKVFADKADLKDALQQLELESLFQDSNANSANNFRRNSTLFSNNNSVSNNTVSKTNVTSESQFISEDEFFKYLRQKPESVELNEQLIFEFHEVPQALLYLLKNSINNYIKLAVRFIGLKDEAKINPDEKINQAISAQKNDVKDSHKTHRLIAIRALLSELKALQNSIAGTRSVSPDDGASIVASLITSFNNALDVINAHEDNKFGDGSSKTFMGSLKRGLHLSSKPSISEIFTKYKEEKPALERMAKHFANKSHIQGPKPGSSTME